MGLKLGETIQSLTHTVAVKALKKTRTIEASVSSQTVYVFTYDIINQTHTLVAKYIQELQNEQAVATLQNIDALVAYVKNMDNTLSANIADLALDMSALQQSLAQSNISLQNQIDTLSAQVADLTARVSALENPTT